MTGTDTYFSIKKRSELLRGYLLASKSDNLTILSLNPRTHTLIHISQRHLHINVYCTIPKLLNQTRCPSTEEWVTKMWFIYMELYSAMKNKIM